VRNAAALIALSTVLVVVGSGVLMRLIDRSEYPTIGRGLWWAMQTVTTVGYGDVTPEHTSGRIVARATRERMQDEQTSDEEIHARP
jgi:voltage-gated potassium channel